MLKIYSAKYQVSVDGEPWETCGHGEFCLEDLGSDTRKVYADGLDFNQTRDFIAKFNPYGLRNEYTCFRRRPYIYVEIWPDGARLFKHNFSSFSYRAVYKEMIDVPLMWLMKNVPADDAIRYLKERGMTAIGISNAHY